MLSASDCETQGPNMSSLGQQKPNILAERLIGERRDHCNDRDKKIVEINKSDLSIHSFI